MSVFISGRLTSPTATELVHGPSGAAIATVAPRDNGGDGSSFSPTDLCTASLAACVATTISLCATRSGIPLDGIAFTIEKQMTAEPPRRIARLVARFRIASSCSDEEYRRLVNAGRTCPVKRSLHPDVVVEETYERA
jgi:putative redox protein